MYFLLGCSLHSGAVPPRGQRVGRRDRDSCRGVVISLRARVWRRGGVVGASLLLFFFELLGTLSGAIEVPFAVLVDTINEAAEHAGALNYSVRLLLDKVRRGSNRLADRHYGSSDDHPGGLACVVGTALWARHHKVQLIFTQ